MIPSISLCSSSNNVLNNFSLEFKNKKTRLDYIDYCYHFVKYLVFTLFQLVMTILLLIASIHSYLSEQNEVTLIFVIVSGSSSMISLIGLVTLCILSRKKKRRRSLYYFIIFNHAFNFGLIFFATKLFLFCLSIDSEVRYRFLFGLLGLYSLMVIFYSNFIESCFIVNLITSLLLLITTFIGELFLKEIGESVYYYPIILVIRIILYFQERKDKLFFYYFKKYNVIYDIHKNIAKSYCIASFSKDDHCFINQNYIKVLSVVTQSKEIKEFKDYEYYPSDYNVTTQTSSKPQSFVSFMKTKCFTNLQHLNEILPEELRQMILGIKEEDIASVDILLNYIRTHGYLFNKMVYIGKKPSIYFKDRTFKISLFYAEKYDSVIYFSSEENTEVDENQLEGDFQLQKFALFASKITHDIKNPLQAIQKLIQNVKTFIVNQKPRASIFDNLNFILNYSEYMLIITKDFECFAKRLMDPNSEKLFEIDFQRINIRKTIQFCSDLIMQIQNKMTIYLNIDINEDVDQFIYSDDIRLKQILINLLSNSIKFTKIGSIHIKCANHDNEYIRLTVADTGFGMKKEELDKLNNDKTVFFKSTINNSYGSGLGISIVKTLIKLLGKDLKIESQYNKGTTISFLINKNSKMMKISLQPYKNTQQTQMSESSIKFISEDNNPNDSLDQITKRVEFDLIKPVFQGGLVTKLVKSSTEDNSPIQKKESPFLDFRRAQTNYCSSLFYQRLTNIRKDYEVIHACSIHRNEDTFENKEQNAIVDDSNMIRILLVEDAYDIRNSQMNLIKAYCLKNNLKVFIEECCDGFECLFKIYQGFSINQKYACIITDDSMKFLSGTFTAYILKTLMQDKTIYPIKIYLTSANTFPKHLIEGIQLFDGIYGKPLDKHHIETVFDAGFY